MPYRSLDSYYQNPITRGLLSLIQDTASPGGPSNLLKSRTAGYLGFPGDMGKIASFDPAPPPGGLFDTGTMPEKIARWMRFGSQGTTDRFDPYTTEAAAGL